MRKILLSLMIVALLVVYAGPVQAAAPSDRKYVIVNETTTSKVTCIPTSLIRPGKDRVLRFEVSSLTPYLGSASTEVIAALYDCTTAGSAINKVLEGEKESNDSDTVEERYIRPLRIANGVTMIQGARTVVLVEWERLIP